MEIWQKIAYAGYTVHVENNLWHCKGANGQTDNFPSTEQLLDFMDKFLSEENLPELEVTLVYNRGVGPEFEIVGTIKELNKIQESGEQLAKAYHQKHFPKFDFLGITIKPKLAQIGLSS